jgi:hypothetical protein
MVITAVSPWLLVLCVIFGGLMLVAAIGAIVYLFVERPQEVTLRIYDRARSYRYVIHLRGKD